MPRPQTAYSLEMVLWLTLGLRFCNLMGSQLGRPAELRAPCHSTGASFTGSRQDQRTLEFGKATEDSDHQLAMGRCGIGPGIGQRPEGCTSIRDSGQDV
jgi:hypothetical protein